MKKYKLIKEYPGSPKLHTILQNELKGYYSQENIGNTHMRRELIENNPEFWEEVIEKDYEILSIIGTNKHPLPKTTLYLKDVYKKDFAGHLNDESNCWQIHSVKRLSDSEIFTIGDKAKTITSQGNHSINSMYVNQKQLNRVITDGIDRIWVDWGNDEGGNWLGSIEKLKQPLFTTEDGVDIYKGDYYYALEDNYENIWLKVVKYVGCTKPNGIKQFSTKESADEYILLNKPCLSINDVINNYHYTPSSIKHRLTELIKSRIFWKNN